MLSVSGSAGLRRSTHLLWAGTALLMAAPVMAQEPLASCEGMLVSSIEISASPAPAFIRGFSSLLLRYDTTRPDVVRAFLLLREGDVCTDQRRAESARILRRQRYIAGARVHAFGEADNTVRIVVETSDDLPLVAGGNFGGGISALTFGSSNIDGRGLLTAVSWESGEIFRDGWGIQVEQTPIAGRPWRGRVLLEREPLGHQAEVSIGQEFLTILQPLAWHAGYRNDRDYATFTRASEEYALALPGDRNFWDVGAVARIGGRQLGFFAGGVLTRERYTRDATPVVITEQGLIGGDPDLIAGRYPGFSNTRISAVLGLRALQFVPAIGVGTLAAEQDLARGVQAGLQFGRSVAWFADSDRDQFVSLDLYAGNGTPTRFLAGGGTLEARRDLNGERWDGIIASGRVAAYVKPSLEQTWELSVEMSGGWRERLPLQLTLGNSIGGLRGFRSARDGGARRVVTRLERRQMRGTILGERAAWGYALFADGGKLWSGDVPFGVTTSVRGSVGASLLAAVPAQSRRLLRLDLAVPVTTGSPDGWQVRVSSVNSAARFWREPGDVFRARSGASRAGIFQWP
jgi:hypothetical protein